MPLDDFYAAIEADGGASASGDRDRNLGDAAVFGSGHRPRNANGTSDASVDDHRPPSSGYSIRKASTTRH
jgi:hypothetical protein